MSKVLRSVKNVTKGYSTTQVKVRNATSNDPWGPTGSEMSEIARMTFDTSTDFFEIMDMLDKRLNDKGKNWRHVLKALKVLDYCLHEGSEHVVVWAKDNMYIIKTLREFQYIDEEGRDQGLNVRVAAKELTSLLLDEERLRNERKDRKSWKSRVMGIEDQAMGSNGGGYPGNSERHRRPRRASDPPRRTEEEDWEYRMAIEASKNQAEQDRKRMSQKQNTGDDDLAKAIKLSQEEEERRQRELEESNADSLFGETPVAPAQLRPQPTTFQQPMFQQDYQQGQMVDFWGNPVNTQSTGYLNSVYAQPTAQYGGQQFPQPTGFDLQQQQQQTGYISPIQAQQPTGFAMANPYGQNGGGLSPQQTAYLSPGANNPYANGLAPQAQPLQPLPTGSNNPFAPKMNLPTSSPPRTGPPSLSTLAEQQQQAQFASYQQQQSFSQPSFTPQSSNVSSIQAQAQPQKPVNPQHAQLEALLQGGNGLDTFGNTGDLRIPAQHTAPGTFVNSAGMRRGPMNAQVTGNNPFYQNSQFTGMPQTTGFGAGGGLQAPHRGIVPSHTGPAGMNGYSSNPFGQPQQPQAQQQQGNNLIDL